MQQVRVIAMVLAVMAAPHARGEAARVCFEPAHPCPGFQPNDLSFPLASDGKARTDQRSAPFFAVMLKSVPRCAMKGAEAAQIQALFPERKVFYSRFECDGDLENNVSYANVDPKTGFIAVYAGESRGAANEVLAKVKSLNRFPGANLRSLQVIFNSP